MFVPFKKISSTGRLISIVITTIVVLGCWSFLHSQNPVIPSPASMPSAWMDQARHGLLIRLAESYSLNLQAMALATIISFGFAYLSVIETLRPFIKLMTKLRFLGFTGIGFLFGMYAEGRALQVWMLTFGISVFYLTSMNGVIATIPDENVNHARTLRMGPWETTYEVVIRGSLDQSIDVLRQTAAMGWMMLTMVEGLVRSQGGVGVMLIDNFRRLNLSGVFAISISILFVGILQDEILNFLRKTICPYSTIKE